MTETSKYSREGKRSHLKLLVSSSSANVRRKELPCWSGCGAPCDRGTLVASGNRTNVLSGGGPGGNQLFDAGGMFDEGELDTSGRTTALTQSPASLSLLS